MNENERTMSCHSRAGACALLFVFVVIFGCTESRVIGHPPGDRASVERELCIGVYEDFCTGIAGCCDGGHPDTASCVADYLDRPGGRECSAFVHAIPGLDDGSVRVDWSRLDAFRRAYRDLAATCRQFDDAPQDMLRGLFFGDRPEGAPCSGQTSSPVDLSGIFRCAPGLVCAGHSGDGTTYFGTCRPPLEEGAACAWNFRGLAETFGTACGEDLVCGDDGMCIRPRLVGSSCTHPTECQSGVCAWAGGELQCIEGLFECPSCGASSRHDETLDDCTWTFVGCPGEVDTRYEVHCAAGSCECRRNDVVVGGFESATFCEADPERAMRAANEGCGWSLLLQ